MTLWRYFTGMLARNFLVALGISVMLFFIIDFLEASKAIVEFNVPVMIIVQLFWAKLKLMILQITPLAVLLSVVVTVGALEIRSELLAAQAGCVNPLRFVYYTALFSIPVVLGIFYMEERVVPSASIQAEKINVDYLQRWGSTWKYFHEERLWFKGEAGRLFKFQRVDQAGKLLVEPDVFKLEPSGIIGQRIMADSAVEQGEGSWLFKRATVMDFGPEGLLASRFYPELRLSMPEKISDFKVLTGRPQQMTYSELNELIKHRIKMGIEVRKYLYEKYAKISYPFSIMLVAIVGAMSVFLFRGSATIIRYLMFATVTSFSYWIVYSFSISTSESGLFPPWFAAWMPNMALALMAVSIYVNEKLAR